MPYFRTCCKFLSQPSHKHRKKSRKKKSRKKKCEVLKKSRKKKCNLRWHYIAIRQRYFENQKGGKTKTVENGIYQVSADSSFTELSKEHAIFRCFVLKMYSQGKPRRYKVNVRFFETCFYHPLHFLVYGIAIIFLFVNPVFLLVNMQRL